MTDHLSTADIDRLAAYAARREAEWSRDMDSEQALYEPTNKCEVTIWELQGLIAEARRTVPGLVQYNHERDRADAAETAPATARRELAEAREDCATVMTDYQDAGERLMSMSGDYAAACKERDSARAALVRCRSVLRDIEWTPDLDGDSYCPSCGRYERRGHRDDCAIAAALKEDDNE